MTLIGPGQGGDAPMLLPLLDQLRVSTAAGQVRTRPEAVMGDKAYSSKAIRAHLRSRKITAVIPEPDLSLIHISEPTRQCCTSRMPSSA